MAEEKQTPPEHHPHPEHHPEPEHHKTPPKDHTARNLIVIIGLFAILTAFAFGMARLVSHRAVEQTQVEYNHFIFKKNQGLWETTVQVDGQPYLLTTRYTPLELQNVTVTGNLSRVFDQGPVYMTFDPNPQNRTFSYLALATGELGLSLAKALFTGPHYRDIVQGCISDAPFCVNVTRVSCDDRDKAVIMLNDSGPTRLELKGNCMVIGGEKLELLRAVDRVLFQWYQIT